MLAGAETGGERLQTAHLVEHVVVEQVPALSTRRSIWELAAELGAVRGEGINAQTFADMTMYQLSFPSAKPDNLLQALPLVRAWAGGAKFSQVEIDREKAAVAEEARRGNAQVAAADSEVLRSRNLQKGKARSQVDYSVTAVAQIDLERARNFYTKWYRPENEALIIVGNVDPNRIASEISRLFGDMTPATHPRDRARLIATPAAGQRYVEVGIPREVLSQITLRFLRGPDRGKAAELRSEIAGAILASALELRLSSLENVYSPSLSGLSVSVGGDDVALELSFFSDPQSAKANLKHLFAMIDSASRLGLTDADLQAALGSKSSLLFAQQFKPSNASIALFHIDRLRTGRQRLSPEVRADKLPSVLADLTPEALTSDLRRRLDFGRVELVVKRPALASPLFRTGSDAFAMLTAVRSQEPVPFVPPVPVDPAILRGAPVDIGGVSAGSNWAVANDLRRPNVVFRQDTSDAGMITITATTPGGRHRYRGSDFLLARAALDIAANSGLAGLDRFAFEGLKQRLGITTELFLSADHQGIRVRAPSRELAAATRIVYEYLARPSFRADAFADWKKSNVKSPSTLSEGEFSYYFDLLAEQMLFGAPLGTSPEAELGALSLDDARTTYRQMIGGVSPLDIVVAGDFQQEEANRLVEQNLASLRKMPAPEPAAVRQVIQTSRRHYIPIGEAGRATVRIVQPQIISAMRDVENREFFAAELQRRLMARLREKEQATYHVFVSMLPAEIDGVGRLQIEFVTAPENAARMADIAVGELRAFETESVGQGSQKATSRPLLELIILPRDGEAVADGSSAASRGDNMLHYFAGALALAATGSTDAQRKLIVPPKNVFVATVVASEDDNALRLGLERGEAVTLQKSLARGRSINFLLGIAGCAPNVSGECRVTAKIKTMRPDGKPWGEFPDQRIFDGPATEADGRWKLWSAQVTSSFDEGEPVGDYVATFIVKDEVADVTREVTYTVTATDPL